MRSSCRSVCVSVARWRACGPGSWICRDVREREERDVSRLLKKE